MNIKELIQQSVDLIEGSDYSHDEEKDIYNINVNIDGDTDKVHVYQDIFEDEDSGISKKIIVCESFISIYKNTTDLLRLSKSNDSLFFARAYVSEEDGKILVESCVFMENMNPLNLSAVIREVAEHSIYLKDDLL
jgi:hypothetical protein